MNPQTRSLLWREWRETRSYRLAFLAWMLLGVVYVVGYEKAHPFHAGVGRFSAVALVYSWFATVALGSRLARGEWSDGTHRFTEALPTTPRHVALVRLLVSSGALIRPILVAAALLSGALATGAIHQAVLRVPENQGSPIARPIAPIPAALENLWAVTWVSVLGAVQLLLLITTIGTWVRTRAAAGLAGAVGVLMMLQVATVLWFGPHTSSSQWAYGILVPQSLVVEWGYGSEAGSYIDHEIVPGCWSALILSIPLLALLAWGCIGRLAAACDRAPRQRAAAGGGCGARARAWDGAVGLIHGRTTALIWLELRQALPLSFAGLGVALLMAGWAAVTELRHQGHGIPEGMLLDLPHNAWAMGTLWGAVVGSALFAGDLSGGLGEFWRSRPIPPRLWFCIKFLIGWASVLVALDLSTILATWAGPRPESAPSQGMSWAYVACVPLMHSFLYALAVLGTCWLRRPILGATAAILAYGILTAALGTSQMTRHLDPLEVFNRMVSDERRSGLVLAAHGYPQVYATLAIACLLLGLASYYSSGTPRFLDTRSPRHNGTGRQPS
jgi:hypothetical protein